MTECYRNGDHYTLTDRHHTTCIGEHCKGCEPCHRHCTCRRACPEHISPSNPLTAPACIGRARDNLRAIISHLPDLEDEATTQGIDSEAAMLTGPALDTPRTIEAAGHRQMSIAMGRIKGDVEPHSRHPLIVLGWWETTLREAYGQELDDHLPGCVQTFAHCDGCRRITEYTAASYLEDVLDRVAQDPDQEFSKLASELAQCRAHLEVTLHASRRPETGAPCPTCTAAGTKAASLKKVYAEHADQTMRIANRACELGQTIDDTTGRSRCPTCRGDNDTWQCPTHTDHTWTDAEYQLRVDHGYLANATHLTATEIEQVHGIPAGTIRRWASTTSVNGTEQPPRLRHAGRSPDGRLTYPVEKVLQLRNEPRRKTA